MTLRPILSILTFSILFYTSCRVDSGDVKVATNDTTQVFKLLIDSAFYRGRLPDFSTLTRHNPFGDTIIIKFDSILVGHLPHDLKYKFLTQDEICSLAIQHYSDSAEFCNFLALNSFKKVDTTYEVSLQNQCVMPLFDKNGKALFSKDFYQKHNTCRCLFGFLCGGGMAMNFIKQGDTLKAKVVGCWSD